DQMLALEPTEIFRQHANAAAKRRAMLLAALRAMAIQRRHQRPGDLEFDAAAQAAAVDGGHGGFLCCARRRLTYAANKEFATHLLRSSLPNLIRQSMWPASQHGPRGQVFSPGVTKCRMG